MTAVKSDILAMQTYECISKEASAGYEVIKNLFRLKIMWQRYKANAVI